jgi:hypothetical protein
MLRAGILAAACAAAITCLGGVAASAEQPIATANGVAQFRFLRGSKWYVPPETLPAMEFKLSNGRARALIDQTVWDITDYRYGYFRGRTVAVFKYAATGEPLGEPACSRMVGSVTPTGRVHITFIPNGDRTMSNATVGTGTLTGSDQEGWVFEMQMSTGFNSVVAHWSYMEQCKPGQPCETQLPGSTLSLEEFLAQCD